jgi:hypothetical protein
MAKVGDLTVGIGKESTVGTAVSPTRRLEVTEESLKLNIDRVESKALKTSRRYLSSTGWANGNRNVDGDVAFEIPSAGFGLILQNLLGAPTITANSPVTGTHTHVYSGLTSVDTQALTFQVVRTDVTGTQHKFTYSGVKFPDAEIDASATGDFVTFKASVDGWDETVSAAAPTSASYTSATPLMFTGASVTIGGSSVPATDINLKIATGLKTDRYYLGSDKKANQVETDMRQGSGTITLDWSGLTQYQRYATASMATGSTAAIVAKFQTQEYLTGTTYGYLQVDIPAARFDGETPTNGGDLIQQGMDFVATDDGTNDPFKITYVTTDAAA